MTYKVFLDTNVLVYALDHRNSQKQERARQLLQGDDPSRSRLISTQVLQEFYVAATRKLGCDALLARKLVQAFCEQFEVVTVTSDLVKTAIDICIVNQTSFWDALVVAAAKHSACAEIWTEDLNAGQVIEGIRVVNPFA